MSDDYEAALNDLANVTHDGQGHDPMRSSCFIDEHRDIIINALRLAAKVTGEPSEWQINCGRNINDIENTDVVKDIYLAMIAQAIKEIEVE